VIELFHIYYFDQD